jgi:predicted nuclease with RNAse H fold
VKDGYLGIDVQLSAGCAYAMIDERHRHLASGWTDSKDEVADERAVSTASALQASTGRRIVVGIDAPRRPLPAARRWRFDRKRWRPLAPSAKGHGRHCELIVSALRLATPQWTPALEAAPPWMRLGFRLFAAFDAAGFRTHEVFPSASYAQLVQEDLRFEVSTAGLRPRPKDMLDAHLAAVTVAEFEQKRGCEVGGGDGLGTIVLPRPVTYGGCAGVECWPVGRS